MVLGAEVVAFTTVYLDDICIASTSIDKHFEHLRKHFERLIEYNITIKFKSAFFAEDKNIFRICQ